MTEASRRLFGDLKPHRRKLFGVILLGVVVASVQPASAKLTQLIIDSLKTEDYRRTFQVLPFLLMMLFVLGGLAKYFYNTIRRQVVELFLLDYRREVFQKYLTLPVSFIDRTRTGEMLSNIQNDLALINQGADTVFGILKEPLAFIGLLGMAFYFDWRLALCSSVAAPLVVLLFSKPGAAVKRYSYRNLELFADLVSLGQEVLVGARVVKVFGLERALGEKFRENQKRYLHTALKSIRVQELAAPSVELLGASIMSIILYYGGYRISSGQMTAGDLIGFILTLGLCQMPIKNLNNAYLKLKTAEAAAERIFALLDRSAERDTGFRPLLAFENRIIFENLSLSYGDKAALRDVSFEVRRGECVAFVGLSGSGKSSLVNLLPRFYDPTGGRILLDGHDLRDYQLEDLRSQIGFVSQDIFLFHDTVKENIRYGSPGASDAEVVRAAELAHCGEFVESLPMGYGTILGERGVCLSGGERQRVAIARAILKNAPILVLDEATSNLDSQSEKRVQEALEVLMTGRTTLMVAHRFSVVSRAERIYVLREGRLLETGTHHELLRHNGHFSQLFGSALEGAHA
ncbi:MAG: ATP-binding cassette domain-containing protein [Deltaproteobacteria bacterium]|nr:ATP-binding cassette domain-containing protein [Deltaproteobacteria bacterium]MBI3293466.1 ATP-binding cassette domain-containing protein [Deltaproteobacteria bacterium]